MKHSFNNLLLMIAEEPNMQQSLSAGYQNPGYTVIRRQDGIIQVEFTEGYNMTLQDARKQMEVFRQLVPEGKCVLLAIFRENASFDREVREFIAGAEVSEIVKADALVIKGLALKILTNGYLRINRPGRPCRVFNSASSALKWLHLYL